jgi:tetratricopeptide (TPR) repeat protein
LESKRADWQSDLARCYANVGDTLFAQGQLGDALESHRKGRAILARLTQQNSDNADWQRALSLSCERVGAVLSEQGELDGAIKSYRDGLLIREKLLQTDPDSPFLQFGIAYCSNEIGRFLVAQQKWAEAADAFARALQTARSHFDQWFSSDWDWITKFGFAAGHRWMILRDAPAGTVKLDRDAALRDLHTARDAMARVKEAGKLVPPMDRNLPWIEGLLEAAEKATAAPAR